MIIIIIIIIIIILMNNAYILILPISSRGAHIAPNLPKKTGIFPVKIVRNQDAFALEK